MARVLSQTLTRISSSPLPNSTILYTKSSSSSSPLALSPRILSHRNQSNQSGKAQLVEVDLDSDGSGGGEIEVMGVRKLEDVIHSIIVRRSAPDWLPFIPGSSYWVPPRRRPSGIVELIGKLTKPLSEEEGMSFTTERGWPSSTYFIEGNSEISIPRVSVWFLRKLRKVIKIDVLSLLDLGQ
ncbi:hypothetical protein HYC85_003766 [Camellia sinensis]|uniref:Uncharacterized protein n=1 Tax=Camellia sinensis TaxID=4442 RepID=A0A7J7HWB9_CAMSI|nr:hypothetical protein HYC85_003766 [Camellia sinensis]